LHGALFLKFGDLFCTHGRSIAQCAIPCQAQNRAVSDYYGTP
jgi:hypothetical protein